MISNFIVIQAKISYLLYNFVSTTLFDTKYHIFSTILFQQPFSIQNIISSLQFCFNNPYRYKISYLLYNFVSTTLIDTKYHIFSTILFQQPLSIQNIISSLQFCFNNSLPSKNLLCLINNFVTEENLGCLQQIIIIDTKFVSDFMLNEKFVLIYVNYFGFVIVISFGNFS